MKAFWEGLSARERLLFQVAGGLAAALLFSLVILRPFNEWQAAQNKALQRAEGLYEIVVEAAAFSGNKSIDLGLSSNDFFVFSKIRIALSLFFRSIKI